MSERILIALLGFIIGSASMLTMWTHAAERGTFEVGGIVYKATPVKP